MKEGRTHLAHKTEHADGMATGPVVGVTIQGPIKVTPQRLRRP